VWCTYPCARLTRTSCCEDLIRLCTLVLCLAYSWFSINAC
jgi:hypothetical protein